MELCFTSLRLEQRYRLVWKSQEGQRGYIEKGANWWSLSSKRLWRMGSRAQVEKLAFNRSEIYTDKWGRWGTEIWEIKPDHHEVTRLLADCRSGSWIKEFVNDGLESSMSDEKKKSLLGPTRPQDLAPIHSQASPYATLSQLSSTIFSPFLKVLPTSDRFLWGGFSCVTPIQPSICSKTTSSGNISVTPCSPRDKGRSLVTPPDKTLCQRCPTEIECEPYMSF